MGGVLGVRGVDVGAGGGRAKKENTRTFRDIHQTYQDTIVITFEAVNETAIVDTMEVIDQGNLFFFQAEDGIRDGRVTGVQTCALQISVAPLVERPARMRRVVVRARRERPD